MSKLKTRVGSSDHAATIAVKEEIGAKRLELMARLGWSGVAERHSPKSFEGKLT
ncbi:hypothetical protein [Rhizobium herbae]